MTGPIDITGRSRCLIYGPYIRLPRLTATPNGPDDTFTGKGQILIVDGVYKWAPDGNPTETNLKLQGEFFIGRSHGLFDALDYSTTQTGC